MWTLSNALSFCRIPLAFLFLWKSMAVRLSALILAGVSDILDGWLARRFNTVTRVGAMLDPLMDKFFLFTVLGIFGSEGTLSLLQIGAFVSRDIFLVMFGIYLLVSGQWRLSSFRSFLTGKILTIVQYIGLFCLVLGWAIPTYVYIGYVLLGILFFLELVLAHRQVI